MKVKDVVGGYGPVVIFELEDDIYALADTKREIVRYDWYWLYVAKYEAVWSSDQMDEGLIEKARGLVEKDEIDEGQKKDLEFKIKYQKPKAKIVFDDQDKLIEQSRNRKKAIFLR